jgi:hypothetical protein
MQKLKDLVEKFLKYIKSLFSDTAYLYRKLDEISESIIKGDYAKKFLDKIDDSKFRL